MRIEPSTPTVGVFGASRSTSRFHAGIDLYAAAGTPVYAITAGTVQNIILFYESLMAVEIANRDGTTIRYCELSPSVKVGDPVSQGQQVGKLRNNSSGTCMLHLEIYAAVSSADLTQTTNKNNYLYVPAGKKSFLRRKDLVDPSAVYSLPRP